MSDHALYRELIRLAEAGVPAALATVVETSGSSPRKAGAKMLVRHDGTTLGTVGGGRVELETVAAALAAIHEGRPRTVAFTLTEEHGHVCGGRVLVYVEPSASRPRLIIAGAGHIGKALARAASFAGYRVTVADDRPGYADREELPGADEVLTGEYDGLFERIAVDGTTAVVIATTGFEKDFAAVRGALRTPAPFIGLIGSARKREALLRTLADEGYPPEEIGRVTIPVGLAIGAETPEEIAVSIVAQFIERRRLHAGIGTAPGRRELPADGGLQAAAAAR
ncbi:XdhC family protein [Geobacter sp.]|uniref:XdhC family protein n=1 Tax=Geobacter sp. TaxID=46610 RepID=UPI002633F648|nr:XdhC/CoxI family protein [Geobacter sp.]